MFWPDCPIPESLSHVEQVNEIPFPFSWNSSATSPTFVYEFGGGFVGDFSVMTMACLDCIPVGTGQDWEWLLKVKSLGSCQCVGRNLCLSLATGRLQRSHKGSGKGPHWGKTQDWASAEGNSLKRMTPETWLLSNPNKWPALSSFSFQGADTSAMSASRSPGWSGGGVTKETLSSCRSKDTTVSLVLV